MDPPSRKVAQETKGFMPDDEAQALYDAGVLGSRSGPIVEIGSYCGLSTLYLGSAAKAVGTTVYTIDHHRGSEEHQPGEKHHDPELYDARAERFDTLPALLRTIAQGRLCATVAPLIGLSEDLAGSWSLPLGMVFIDGGHSERTAQADYEGWAPHIVRGGLLAIHDVFEDPAEGGRPPYNVLRRALAGGAFVAHSRSGSLRVLKRLE